MSLLWPNLILQTGLPQWRTDTLFYSIADPRSYLQGQLPAMRTWPKSVTSPMMLELNNIAYNCCLVLVNSHLFALLSGAGSTVPREGFNLSVIILASLLVFPMFGCRHSLLHCNISHFSQVECTFSNIPTCVHLPVGGHYLVLLALTFRY